MAKKRDPKADRQAAQPTQLQKAREVGEAVRHSGSASGSAIRTGDEPIGDSTTGSTGDSITDPAFEPASQRRFLRFAVGTVELALELGRLEEIVEPGKITRAPGAPPWLLGALNLRGQALPVLDLAVKLGLPAEPGDGMRPAVLVFRPGAQAPRLGIRVSGVLGFVEVDEREIAPAPRFGGVLPPGLLSGLVSIDGRFVPWLDLSAAVAA